MSAAWNPANLPQCGPFYEPFLNPVRGHQVAIVSDFHPRCTAGLAPAAKAFPEGIAGVHQPFQEGTQDGVEIVGFDEGQAVLVREPHGFDQRLGRVWIETEQLLVRDTEFIGQVAQRDTVFKGLDERGMGIVQRTRNDTELEPDEQASNPFEGVGQVGPDGLLVFLGRGVVPSPAGVDRAPNPECGADGRNERERM